MTASPTPLFGRFDVYLKKDVQSEQLSYVERSTNTLWLVELISVQQRGGPLQWRTGYALRHVGTGKLLTLMPLSARQLADSARVVGEDGELKLLTDAQIKASDEARRFSAVQFAPVDLGSVLVGYGALFRCSSATFFDGSGAPPPLAAEVTLDNATTETEANVIGAGNGKIN